MDMCYRWSKRMLNWWPEGRKSTERPEMKWERKVGRVMRQNNLTAGTQ
jgi:hypothetical protein